MTLRLVMGSLNYSSWSARAWLALTHAKIEFRPHLIQLFVAEDWKQQVLQFCGTGKVPVLVDGTLSIHEALAICEYAAELAPEANLWPEDRSLRARARALGCEMASDFLALRSELPMNVRGRARPRKWSDAASAEIQRAQDIWSASLQSSGGPFLFGSFSIADCMYAPVVSRFKTYDVELGSDARQYSEVLWDLPLTREWLREAQEAAPIPRWDAFLD